MNATCDPPTMHVYLKGAAQCECGSRKDGHRRVIRLAESDWLKLLADDPRAVPPGQEGPS